MGQVVFIVWRESIEAMLVVGILYMWLRSTPKGRRGLPWLWGGVLVGLLLAAALALALLGISKWLTDTGQEWFQVLMALAACCLIVQMVTWMHNHGRSLSHDLESNTSAYLLEDRWLGVLVLAAIAVAREGSEAVVFIYGVISASAISGTAGTMVIAGLAGFIAALVTFWILQIGGKIFNWKRFFRFTEILLLLLACSLLMSASDRLILLEVLPALVDPIWDSNWLLDTTGGVGKVLADFAGYRSYPALSQLILFVMYWLCVAWLLRKRTIRPAGHVVPS